ncbi:HsdM-like protein [Sphingobacterium alimentarium]|uniref:HsdM-like protein n=1 Tax=Sphingobacterium alimentarium TaxID=797292 RepID=A0A4V2VTA7_9SPHI|nr:type I restriction-modification system subunit M N-terminal domain-containing protein [Sphingobacterium alimentarium]TCV05725.1 HsdM-like protein [Sphingobacterium alimentarium]
MAVKKRELYSSLWASCDELRGGMDASQYKDYVLTILFVKYIGFLIKEGEMYYLKMESSSWKSIILILTMIRNIEL